ncbi:energy transducer TonB [Grimontia hollisae]|uniref:energy transducer TonB n=1 Tax=Grimontia hollisae TaxID=673 RepID=UPI0012AC62EE|nr:energy transducer TonB [Grimontia hollisae]
MNAQRYVICGVVSVALHSLAIFAQPPSPQFTLHDANTGNRVAIKLVATAKPAPKEPAPSPVDEPPHTQASDPVERKAPEPPAAPKPSEISERAKMKKTELPRKAEPKPKTKTEKKPVETVKKQEPKKEKKQPARKKINDKPNEKPKETVKKVSSETQANQTAASSPVLVDKVTFKVRPSQPNYPRMAKRKGMEGTVLLEVWLDENGDQTNLSLLKSSGFDLLDDAAIEAVRKWQFNSHKENGVALAHRVRIPVRFNLD